MAEAAQPEDISGVALAAAFSAEVVEPLLAQNFPRLRYAAALIGPGSEILGFDEAMHGFMNQLKQTSADAVGK